MCPRTFLLVPSVEVSRSCRLGHGTFHRGLPDHDLTAVSARGEELPYDVGVGREELSERCRGKGTSRRRIEE